MKQTGRNMSYAGGNVYIGIDVHKKTYSVTAISEGDVVRRDTMQARPEALASYMRNHFKGASVRSAYEAGFSGFALHRTLAAAGIENIVVNPASIEVAANDKVKTDRRDSRKQAEQLSRGAMSGIYIPTENEELGRCLSRGREQVVRNRAAVSMQIKGKLHYWGLMPFDDNRVVTESYLKELEGRELPAELSFVLRILASQWRTLTEHIKSIEEKLVEQAAGDEYVERIYRSVPGIGPISSRVLSNELGDLSKRFANERALASFTGLTPSEHSSGDKIRKGHISRQGSARIRKCLVEIAWRAIKIDPALGEVFMRIARTRGKKRAIVAIARKLIIRIRACFRQICVYQYGVGV